MTAYVETLAGTRLHENVHHIKNFNGSFRLFFRDSKVTVTYYARHVISIRTEPDANDNPAMNYEKEDF